MLLLRNKESGIEMALSETHFQTTVKLTIKGSGDTPDTHISILKQLKSLNICNMSTLR